MKPHRLIAPLALAFVALFVGAAPPAAHATTCRHADIVFYSNDTIRLAQRLHNDQSACADYYISVTPAGDGISPRSGVAGSVRANGPQFHAMPEIRLTPWAAWVQANGKTWYDAGVEARRRMVTAGFDVSQGDTWAIDEVGAPSGTPMGVDVFTGAGTARADLRDFVRGLYTGDAGMPPAPGLVFAADPTQITSDLSQYKQQLENFYGDSAFWTDMSHYVRFWAQETYADARSWGVAGSTLDDRAAHLNDYFQHGLLLGEAGPGSTDAARSFLEAAYTPVGNSAYLWTEPELMPGGIGYGYTNVPLLQMQNFVSTQTYAFRSFSAATGTGDRFGFAWWLKTTGIPATTFVSLADRIAGAIHGSETGAIGACGASGEWCDTSVDGAQFTDAWKAFAAWSPPTNTPEGSSVQVQVAPTVTVTFSSVSSRGSTQLTTSATGAAPPQGVQLRPGALYYDLETTASFTGPVDVCIGYDAAIYDGFAPRLFRFADGNWSDATTTVDSTTVCGSAPGLETFAILAADPTPPTVVPHVVGPVGDNGWYTGDVTVTWDVADPQSAVTSSGCDATTISADTPGTTLTCTATSDGGSTPVSVTVKRDATPPALDVGSGVVVDATSLLGAAATFAPTATDAIDPSPTVDCTPPSGTTFAIGTTTVSCTATDAAGNASTAAFTVHVEGATEQLADLAASVTDVGPGKALVTTVAVAQWFLAHDQSKAACLTLTAFDIEVRLWSGRTIPKPQATALIVDAKRIQHVLGCTT